MNEYRLPAAVHIGYVHLKVSDSEKMLRFYEDLLGFQKIKIENGDVALSSNGRRPYHIIMTEDRKARHRRPHTAGLFHLAIRVPSRLELARVFLRLYEHHYPFQGFADHGVSEALYMADPEGNGVEIYADRPKEQWQYLNGRLQMTTDPLDANGLIIELKNEKNYWNGLHPDTDIGHIHLQVSKLSLVDRFYHSVLGMDITQDTYPGALFLSAGGYHHHVGANIWAGEGLSPADPDTAGLAGYGIYIGDPVHKTVLLERLQENGLGVERRINGYFTRDLDRISIELIFDD